MNNNSKENLIYHILEGKYIKMFDRKITANINDNADLFPFWWYANQDVQLKIRILLDAIEKNKKISEVDLYQNIIESVEK